MDKFTSFEGHTGPYILYTIVRIKSILAKYASLGKNADEAKFYLDDNGCSKQQKNLMIGLTKFTSAIESAYDELAPNKICAYIYDLANSFNSFYHETKIMTEEDAKKQEGYIALLVIVKHILEDCISILGFSAPEKM